MELLDISIQKDSVVYCCRYLNGYFMIMDGESRNGKNANRETAE